MKEPHRVMFVFAHQDDEIAYLGKMRNLVKSGRDVRVVWITDGAHYVPAEVRRRESTGTLRALGIGADRLDFWEYPDGVSISLSVEIVERLTRVMSEMNPAEVYTVAYEGAHPDHDFANFAAVTAARRQSEVPAVYEASLYNRFWSFFAVNRLIPAETRVLYTRLSPGDVLFKMRALFRYRSQLWMTMVPVILFGRTTVGRHEAYREVPAWNYRQPPHEGKLFYEGWLLHHILGLEFHDFHEAVSRVLDKVYGRRYWD